jgi:hypothetical protein
VSAPDFIADVVQIIREPLGPDPGITGTTQCLRRLADGQRFGCVVWLYPAALATMPAGRADPEGTAIVNVMHELEHVACLEHEHDICTERNITAMNSAHLVDLVRPQTDYMACLAAPGGDWHGSGILHERLYWHKVERILMPRFHKSLPRWCCLGIASLASIVCTGSAPTEETDAEARSGCSSSLRNRTPTEAIEEHLALLQGGELERALCDYASDAVVVLPGQIASGIDAIRAGLSGFAQLFGDAVPQVDSLTSVDAIVLLTFHVVGSELSIPNGSDTYVVKQGLIRYQTVHDVIIPTVR